MPLGTDISKVATCTTCTFTDDLSNYWTANLYFKARNGSYKRVPQMANKLLNGEQGGLTVYYTSPGGNQVTAFKPVGFQMGIQCGLVLLRNADTGIDRASVCSMVMPHPVRRGARGGNRRAASAALPDPTSKATMHRLASTPNWIPRHSRVRRALAESAPTSSSRRKKPRRPRVIRRYLRWLTRAQMLGWQESG